MTTKPSHQSSGDAGPSDRASPSSNNPHDTGRWVALLAKWTDLARAAASLPDDGDAGRWRIALPAIIELQAVTHALDEFRRDVDAVDHALAIDKATLMLRRSIEAIHAAWHDAHLPDGVVDVIDDARQMVARASTRSFVWFAEEDGAMTEDPTPLAVLAVRAGIEGKILAMAPGVPIFANCPAIVAVGAMPAVAIAAVDELVRGVMRESMMGPALTAWVPQVYRQWDFGAGRVVRDVVAPMDGDVLAGQPLLVPIYEDGEILPLHMAPRGVDPGMGVLPVELADDAGEFLLEPFDERDEPAENDTTPAT